MTVTIGLIEFPLENLSMLALFCRPRYAVSGPATDLKLIGHRAVPTWDNSLQMEYAFATNVGWAARRWYVDSAALSCRHANSEVDWAIERPLLKGPPRHHQSVLFVEN
jgi:hypothetical protein